MGAAARDYLTIPAAEVAVERLFNRGRALLGLRRHSLNGETTEEGDGVERYILAREVINHSERIGWYFLARDIIYEYSTNNEIFIRICIRNAKSLRIRILVICADP